MPHYETPEPISVTLELGVGDVRVTASDRSDTVVVVRPSDEADDSDVKAAQQVRIDHTGGTLQITGPKTRAFDFSRKTRSVEVTIELPAGSHMSAEMQMGDVRCTGRLGECRLKTSTGNLSLQRTGPLRLDTSTGHITADAITGHAEISTGSGKIHIGEIEGTAVIKNTNGDTTINTITGDTRVRAANGDIHLQRAGADVDAKTSNGSIHLGEATHGTITLETAIGDLNIGIAEGTTAWLQINTKVGRVHNLLDNTTQPENTDQTVEIHGRTSHGDITIHRS